MMIKILKKLLICICTILIVINFSFGNISFAGTVGEALKDNFKVEDSSGEDSLTLTSIITGIVGIFLAIIKVIMIAPIMVVQTLSALVGNMEGTVGRSRG